MFAVGTSHFLQGVMETIMNALMRIKHNGVAISRFEGIVRSGSHYDTKDSIPKRTLFLMSIKCPRRLFVISPSSVSGV